MLGRPVPPTGPGTAVVVPGTAPSTAPGRAVRVRVEVEEGLPVDGAAFADFVTTTLQDPRGWVQEGWSFSRTDGDADVVVTLASPATSAAMCAPLDTGGTLSCRTGDDALVVLERMTEGRFRHLPVVDEEGRMLGLVSIGDAVSGRLKELAAEKQALEGMIMGV